MRGKPALITPTPLPQKPPHLHALEIGLTCTHFDHVVSKKRGEGLTGLVERARSSHSLIGSPSAPLGFKAEQVGRAVWEDPLTHPPLPPGAWRKVVECLWGRSAYSQLLQSGSSLEYTHTKKKKRSN